MEKEKNVKKDEPAVSKLELEIEELEPMVAPALTMNHNETVVRDSAS